MTDASNFLKSFNVFQDLSQEEFLKIGSIFKQRQFPKGTLLFKQDEPADQLYLIEKGQVEISRVIEGSLHTVATQKDGDTLGEMSMFGGGRHTAQARAASDVLTFSASVNEFVKLLADNRPGICKIMGRMMESMVQRYRELEHRTLMLSQGEATSQTTEARLMSAMARNENVRISFSSGTSEPIDGIFALLDLSADLGAPLMRVRLVDSGTLSKREYIVPLSSVNYISFRDATGEY